MWRVLTGQHDSITISFMMVGHTKFAPDWCFGFLKQRFRREKVSCLNDLAAVVSASSKHNIPQLVGKEDGMSYVPFYDWTAFLAPHFKKVPKIKSPHHFTIPSQKPGTLTMKLYADSVETTFNMLRGDWEPSADQLPPIISPPGLSPEQAWYLHDNIRQYCTDETKDVVCPVPAVPRPTAFSDQDPLHVEATEVSSPPPLEPPAKRPRVCGEAGNSARRHKDN